MTVTTGPFSLERMASAVEKVRQRLLRAAGILGAAKVPYAVVGGNAVALWVSRVDEAAVRNTQGVDVLIRRVDLGLAKAAMEAAGFVHRHVGGVDIFLDGPAAKPRDAVHVIFANRAMHLTQPATTGSDERFVCTALAPWAGGPGRVCHPDAVETGPQEPGWPAGDIQRYRCPHCGLTFEVELPQ